MEITGLPSDVHLTNIGSLSRKSGYDSWLITVNYSNGKGENDRKGIKFSNAPALCRGRIYSNDSNGSKKGPVFEFTIGDLEDWFDFEYFHAKYFESPAPITLSSVSARNILAVCRIPKFELARVLFFYNGYLATSALQERALDLDFNTSFIDGKHIIKVLPHCSLKPIDFKDEILRGHLAWLLLNDEVRQSYDSIYKHLMQETTHNGDYENWIFNFTPPLLKNIKVRARFYIDQNDVYRVDEILSITNLTSSIDADVHFTGEHFVDTVVSTNPHATKVTIKPKGDGGSYTVDDESEADVDKSKQIIPTPQVSLQFNNPIKTTVTYKKKRSQKGPKLVDEEGENSEPKTTTVATDEATMHGNVAQGDYRSSESNTEQTVNNLEDYKYFYKLIEELRVKYSIRSHPLPKVKGFRRHRIERNRPRIMIEARFQYDNQHFSVFEIYTLDINKRLSTLIVRVDSYEQLEMQKFMTSIVKSSISWREADLLGKHRTLNHPIGFYEHELDEEMLQKWLNGLERALDSLISASETTTLKK